MNGLPAKAQDSSRRRTVPDITVSPYPPAPTDPRG
jgi:hypothetical protein